MKGTIELSRRELQRTQVLEQVEAGRLSLREGAGLMAVSYRQAKRLRARYRAQGPAGLAHRQRGQPARNALTQALRERIVALRQQQYSQFNDQHFTEMLAEREGIQVGRETVRRLLRQAGIRPKRRRRPPQHRRRRPRRPQLGLLMQWDGSPHHWFGDDQPPCCLLHAVDDAVGSTLGALFVPQENAVGYLRLLDQVLRRHGIPAAVYQDRHAALFRSDTHWSLEEELAGQRFPTHVGRVLQELAIQAIPAYSPQAKGRAERRGGVFQDRLIAELALTGLTDLEAANAWLETTFLPRFNRRFARAPAVPGSAFRPITAAQRYQLVAFAYAATVGNDNCVRLGGLTLDIPPRPGRRTYARCRVLVRQHLDGAWTIWLDGQRIARHPATPLLEPLRVNRPRRPGEDPRAKHLVQVYLQSRPAF